MKKILSAICLTFLCIAVSAQQQQRKKFDPEQFQREQEAYITKEAQLTNKEAANFFPLFRELQDKQRVLFRKQRQHATASPTTEKEAQEIIAERDNIELKICKLRTEYHTKFCKVLSPIKVYKCIQAEEHFKRKLMDKATHRHGSATSQKRKK